MHFLVAFRLDGCCSQYLLLMIVDIDLDLWKYIDIDIECNPVRGYFITQWRYMSKLIT